MKEPLQHWTGLLENGDCATLCVEFWGIRVVFPFVCFAWRWKGWHTHTHVGQCATSKTIGLLHPSGPEIPECVWNPLKRMIHAFHGLSHAIFIYNIYVNRMAPFRGKKLCLSHLGTPGMAASPFAVLHHTPQGTSAETCRCDAIIWHYMTLLIDIIILYAYMTYMAWLMHDIALVVNTFRPFKSWTCLHPLQLRFGRGMCHLGQNGLLWLRKRCHIPRTHLVIATWSPERKTSKFLSPMTKACWLLFEPMNL
jgi:hypothetical protein